MTRPRAARWKRRGQRAATLAIIAGAFLALALAWTNAIDHRAWLIDAFAAHTGRVLTVGQRPRVTLTPLPTLVLEDVSIANPPWAREPALLHARRVTLSVGVPALVLRHPELTRITLEHAVIALERRSGYGVTWAVDSGSGHGTVPAIGRLLVTDSVIHYVDDGGDAPGRDEELRIERGRFGFPAERSLSFDLEGRFQDTPFTLTGTGGSLASLLLDPTDWPLAFLWRGAEAAIRGRGSIDHPLGVGTLDLAVGIVGRNLGALAPLAGLWLPATHSYEARFQLAGDRDHYLIADLEARLADSDVAGRVTVQFASPRPRVTGELRSRTLVTADLTRETLAPAVPMPADDDRLFDTTPLPFAVLANLDASVHLTAERLVTWPMDLRDVDAEIALADAKLTVDPLRATLADGRLALRVEADATGARPRLHGHGTGQNLRLELLLPALGLTPPPTGPLRFELDLAGTGVNRRELFAGVNGRLDLVSGQGILPIRGFDLIAADLIQAMMPWTHRGDTTPLECMAARFSITDGLARAQAMLIDTSRITITGTGTLDLAGEQIDLLFHPQPKDPSLLSLATPMRVYGSFLQHRSGPDAVGLATKGAAGLLLGVLNPIAALVPFMNPGTGSAHPCQGERMAQRVPGPIGFLIEGAKGVGGWFGLGDPAPESRPQSKYTPIR